MRPPQRAGGQLPLWTHSTPGNARLLVFLLVAPWRGLGLAQCGGWDCLS